MTFSPGPVDPATGKQMGRDQCHPLETPGPKGTPCPFHCPVHCMGDQMMCPGGVASGSGCPLPDMCIPSSGISFSHFRIISMFHFGKFWLFHG